MTVYLGAAAPRINGVGGSESGLRQEGSHASCAGLPLHPVDSFEVSLG